MALATWEFEAAGKFCRFMSQTTGQDWAITSTEVPTGNGHDYDCELLAEKGIPNAIALEMTRLFPDDVSPERTANELTAHQILHAELVDRGVYGWCGRVWAPSNGIRKWVQKTADQIAEAASDPSCTEIHLPEVDLTRVPGLASNSFYTSRHGSVIVGPECGWIRRGLQKALVDKHEKFRGGISLSDHSRIVLLVARGYPVASGALIAACSLIDFDQFPAVDEVYFLDAADCVHLVFVRCLNEMLRFYKIPHEPQLEALALQVIWHRLHDAFERTIHSPARQLRWNEPTILELALTVKWDLGNIDWLPDGGEAILDWLCERAIEASGWQTPMEYRDYLRKTTARQYYETQAPI